MTKSPKIFLIAILVILLVVFAFYLFSRNNRSNQIDNGASLQTSQLSDTLSSDESQKELTPEEVLQQMEEPTSIGQNVQMSIISPTEETFMAKQARMWQAQLEGIEVDKSFRAICHWEFYLNQYDDEVLYQQMDNKSAVSSQSPQLCAFTSTFIENKGKLRVKLNVEVQNGYNEIIGNYTAEAKYTVL